MKISPSHLLESTRAVNAQRYGKVLTQFHVRQTLEIRSVGSNPFESTLKFSTFQPGRNGAQDFFHVLRSIASGKVEQDVLHEPGILRVAPAIRS